MRNELLSRTIIDDLPDRTWKRIGALNTWGTNAIEGNTLTWLEVEKLLIGQQSVNNRPVPDVLETIQHEAAFRGLLPRRHEPIHLTTVLELHETVFRNVKKDAGQWRRMNVRIEGSKYTPPRMEKVISAMEEWLAEYNRRDTDGEDVFALAAWMHHQFEAIHPFSDGNGRAGRLLLNLHFLRHNWPPIHILPPDRGLYLRCLENGHDGDLSNLIEFLRVGMVRSLLDLLDEVGIGEDALRPLREFELTGPYSAKYLRLRASQGELPAIKTKGDWRTSERALRIYREFVGER